jgi:hypothetical protein
MKLERNTFQKIKSMLESPDKENVLMGMSCIENSDFKQNLTYIMLMLKEANVSIDEWKNNAKKTLDLLTSVGIDWEQSITFKVIHKVMEDFEVPESDIKFYEERFAEFVKGRASDTAHLPKIEYLTLKVKFKHERGSTGDSVQGPNAEGTVLRNLPDNAEQAVDQ